MLDTNRTLGTSTVLRGRLHGVMCASGARERCEARCAQQPGCECGEGAGASGEPCSPAARATPSLGQPRLRRLVVAADAVPASE